MWPRRIVCADGCEGPSYCSILFAQEARPLERFRGLYGRREHAGFVSWRILALKKLVFAPLAGGRPFLSRAVETGAGTSNLARGGARGARRCLRHRQRVRGARPRASPRRPRWPGGNRPLPAVPGLPWITRAGEPEKIRAALGRAFADPALTGPREALLLSGFSSLDARDYDRITEREAEMEKGGLLLI